VFLNNRAQALEPSDPNRAALSTYYQKLLGLSASEAQILNQVASAADEAVTSQDAKAELIVRQIRAAYPPGRVSSKALLPPRSPELTQLWQDRGAIIEGAVRTLQAQVQPATFAKIQAYVETKCSSYVQALKPESAAVHAGNAGARQ
jgi:hypothetical protein